MQQIIDDSEFDDSVYTVYEQVCRNPAQRAKRNGKRRVGVDPFSSPGTRAVKLSADSPRYARLQAREAQSGRTFYATRVGDARRRRGGIAPR